MFFMFLLTGNRVKGDDDSGIEQHLLFCNHTPDFDYFSILATNNNVTLMESLTNQWRSPSFE